MPLDVLKTNVEYQKIDRKKKLEDQIKCPRIGSLENFPETS